MLAAQDVQAGKRRWKSGRYGHGQMVPTAHFLLVPSESGYVALTEPTLEGHREAARLEVFDRKTWNPTALAAPYLLVRNDEEAACFELPLVERTSP